MTTESTANIVGETALTTAEQLLPVLIEAIAAGQKTATPQETIIAMAAAVIPPLVSSFGASSKQIAQLLTALVPQIEAGQAAIDAAAAARGITDPLAGGTPAP